MLTEARKETEVDYRFKASAREFKTVKVNRLQTLTRMILGLRTYWRLLRRSYLNEVGWFNAVNQKSPIDGKSEALPWVTYPFIEFIRPKLHQDMDVFEFGTGNSTLFYAKLVNAVCGVEHNRDWFNRNKAVMPSNVDIILVEDTGDDHYSRAIRHFDKKFNMVIVDGLERNACLAVAVDHIYDDGVIVLDNALRSEYKPGIEMLQNKGFRKLDFHGMIPGSFRGGCTSVFYKDNNCLGL